MTVKTICLENYFLNFKCNFYNCSSLMLEVLFYKICFKVPNQITKIQIQNFLQNDIFSLINIIKSFKIVFQRRYSRNLKMTEQIQPHVLKKYQIVQKLGKGAYGIVWKAMDRKLKTVVALKKVFDAFHNATDAQRTFRQVMFLQQLNGHQNIVQLLNVMKSQNNKDLYLIFDYMETDLHLVVRAGIIQQIHRKFIIYQLLKALKYMHSAQLIHRDLKPSNILVNSQSKIKVADFGLSRSVYKNKESSQMYLTEYVATRWYRAPEILLGSTQYSKAVDMWSVGCILGQLILGKAMFPGNSTLNQIQRILQITGKPTQQDIESIQSPLASNIISGMNLPKKKDLIMMLPTANPQALDLMRKLFLFDPSKRLTAEEALNHSYLKLFHNNHQKQEVTHQDPVIICLDDNKKFSIREYREVLYQNIAKKKKQQKKRWQASILSKLGFQQSPQINMIPQKQNHKVQTTNLQENQSQLYHKQLQEKYHKPIMSFSQYKQKYMKPNR